MKTLLEVREYNFEGKVRLLVKLDRRTKKASFVKWNGTGYEREQFIFNDRELNYMNGWKTILSAMQYVIDDIRKEMTSWVDEDGDLLIRLLMASGEEK